ncbi:SAM-dependent methyltransferase [Enemella evansiae]|uniref:Eco57I restriction-modification methylase domain-containing protein n=1 Tax=Enemella evansiae TaxID=2016499 RepID=UPI000B9660A5|nr:methyltransferase domain-containing protein [Enemella evansiae]OYO00722.1 SAM-dependent methyltransferase [Enemella evansiae]
MCSISEVGDLIRLCGALGAESAGPLTSAEVALLNEHLGPVPTKDAEQVAQMIREGQDPLGQAYTTFFSPQQRRPLGQTYTPSDIVGSMVGWAIDQGSPSRIVDPGAGSGRYLIAAARAFPEASLVGADIDPLSTLMLRANIAAAGLAARASVVLGDYRDLDLPSIDGKTLYIGNPPYVRHHQISPDWKAWLIRTAKKRGLKASGLAGLHVHFFLATAEHGRSGDYGAFITSAEWLDVNYGSLVRQLLLNGLGGESLHVLDPKASPFADATTTGAITCFKIGSEPESIKVRRVDDVVALGRLAEGHPVSRERLAEANRWSVLTRVTPKLPDGYIELGEVCRVHRGAVTGANKVWVHREGDIDLPDRVLFASVTKARELFGAGDRLAATDALRRVVDLPADLDIFDADERKQIDRFLRAAKKLEVHKGYVAANRKAWWSVGLRAAAPVLATYMARRPPAFVRNDVEARHINIAHGLYPRQELDTTTLDNLAAHLRSAVTLNQGRVYAGGLTKFEPKEMERLPIPSLESLREGDFIAAGSTSPME